ncbi:MAG: hypothetical protein H7839_02420 [Magnetococcus sp. YQC-5]
MNRIDTTHSSFSFQDLEGVPAMEAVISACRSMEDRKLYDVIDFRQKVVNRWSIPAIPMPRALTAMTETLPQRALPLQLSHQNYLNFLLTPHVAQLSESGMLLIAMNNGFFIPRIDTKNNQTTLFPEDYAERLMLYTATGDFFPRDGRWLFVRWPLQQAMEILLGHQSEADCEIGAMDPLTGAIEILYRITASDVIHQVTSSPDGRYLVFTSFQARPVIPYPQATPEQDPEGFRRSHEAGMHKERMVTIDLVTGRHWRTEIPVPVPAHFEFDPVDPWVFYVSAHHFSWSGSHANIVLEGPAALLKMRILASGATVVERSYSDPLFFRITQHMPFRRQGVTLIAVTTIPNKLDLIEAATMTLWRRVEYFAHPPIDFSRTGNAMCPKHPQMCLNVCPSADGRYVILESHTYFLVYDVDQDCFLDSKPPLFLPQKAGRVGHTRMVGQ